MMKTLEISKYFDDFLRTNDFLLGEIERANKILI